MQKIVLVGYMGVGKSTLGKMLSEKMNFKHIDLDTYIEAQELLSVKDIFSQKGEIYFRKVEHEAFKSLLETDENLIISTGGGTPCYANNHLLLNSDAVKSIYLKASISQLFERLKNDKSERPLIAKCSDEELQEFIAKNLFERSYFYNQSSFKINIDGKSPLALAEEILNLLG